MTKKADGRVATGMRLDKDVYEELKRASEERGVPVNWLAEQLLREGLARLVPVDEVRWTR